MTARCRQREIRALRAATDLWDSGKDRELVAQRPVLLIDAIWEQLAREAAGIIQCAKCTAPNCGRWFLRSAGRRRPPVLLIDVPDAHLAAVPYGSR